ncbi:MAG: hypothetical protein ACRDHZ_00240 [Ktedonobacteraceae bacterium]
MSKPQTLQEYFERALEPHEWKQGGKPVESALLTGPIVGPVSDHALRVSRDPDGSIRFYIHPANVDGDTVDFYVTGNKLQVI